MTVFEAQIKVSKLLRCAVIEEPEAKAKVIAEYASGGDPFDEVSEQDFDLMLKMAHRAQKGEPVEYITGEAYFRYVKLFVTPDVLIPRIETELVAGKAIELIKSCGYKKALDMCTGSGCIAISLATETKAAISACDISDKALNIAKKNAKANCAVISFFQSDMFESVSGTYDIIVCNPPYISDEEYETLSRDVKEYEPAAALKAGDGFDFYRIIADEALKFLSEGGALVLEIGASQASIAAQLLKQSGFIEINCSKDYEGRDRIVTALRGI